MSIALLIFDAILGRMAVMNLLMEYSQPSILDGLFDSYEFVIDLYIRKENSEKFLYASRVSREIVEALVRAL
jgi:hypothetical protein